jgi:L-serine dehydratase
LTYISGAVSRRQAGGTELRERLLDMGRSVEEALSGTWNGTLARDQAEDLSHYMQKEDPISGAFIVRASQISMSLASYNSCMGRIVAAPTAGSCGILPGILFSWKERYGTDQESLIGAVVTAAGIGEIIAERATLAGA